tara:strand:- start:223 stop:606 length:384 start_codon:yes stop_codon:yes gene_type:complete
MKKILLGLLFPICLMGQTPNEVLLELRKQNIKYPKIVLAQSLLETGRFTCTTCSMDANNLFGLRNVKENKWFYFNTWQESIGGYKQMIEYKYSENDYNDYYDFLDKIGYAVDPNYIPKLQSIVNKIK